MRPNSGTKVLAKMQDPICIECKCTESLLWRQVEDGDGQLCLECHKQRSVIASEDQDTTDTSVGRTNGVRSNASDSRNKFTPGTRKSTRTTRSKIVEKAVTMGSSSISSNSNHNSMSSAASSATWQSSNTSTARTLQGKGRNRRILFKRAQPIKSVMSPPSTRCVNSVFHKGSYLQVGDIVSLVDAEDNIYYAQIRGLLIDCYSEKSAFLTWLIPTQESPDPRMGFDAATYIIGHDEELSRKVTCMEFVMHAPSNYYLDRTTPYPPPTDADIDQRYDHNWTSTSRMHRNRSTTSW